MEPVYKSIIKHMFKNLFQKIKEKFEWEIHVYYMY